MSEYINQLVGLIIPAADRAAMNHPSTLASRADQVRAAVTAAFEAADANGLITVTPTHEWPDFIVLDPPYQLPKIARGVTHDYGVVE